MDKEKDSKHNNDASREANQIYAEEKARYAAAKLANAQAFEKLQAWTMLVNCVRHLSPNNGEPIRGLIRQAVESAWLSKNFAMAVR
jgi:hypothetical protein